MFLPRFQLDFTQNVVAQAEFRHQRYVINTSRSGRIWILLAMVLLIPAFVASVIFFISGLLAPFGAIYLLPPEVNGSLAFTAFLLLIVTNVSLYVVVQLVTVALGANSILREKQGRTWESLLLTNIDAYQIVWGKWWATIRALWGDQLMVGLLRFGLVAWAVGRFIDGSSAYLNCGDCFNDIPYYLPPTIYILFFTFIVTIYTLLDAAFSSALGIFSPLPDWSGVITFTLILAARVLATMAGLAWFVWTFVAAVDGGLDFVPIAAFGLLGFALLIWLVLRAAQAVAVRGSHASPPERKS